MPHNRSIDVLEISFEQAEEFHACIPEFGNTRPRHSFLKRVGNKKHLVLGAQIEEQMVGYLIGYDRYKDGSFYCWMTGVLPAFRRQGVLEKLMEYALEWAKKRGFSNPKNKNKE
jgi:ribosomal protein S18 acetylase RimI-like enzyme